jgi:hypothetical protein
MGVRRAALSAPPLREQDPAQVGQLDDERDQEVRQ